jgi:hypothetical protein
LARTGGERQQAERTGSAAPEHESLDATAQYQGGSRLN